MGNAGSNPAFGGTYRGIVPAGTVRRGLRCFARSICVVVDGTDFVCSPAFLFLRRAALPPANPVPRAWVLHAGGEEVCYFANHRVGGFESLPDGASRP